MLLAARHLAAYRVLDVYLLRIRGAAAHLLPELFEECDALRGLREEVHGLREIDQCEVSGPLDDDGAASDLSGEPHHFGVPPLSEDHDLPAEGLHALERLHDAALEARHHRTGGVDDLDPQLPGLRIGRGGLPVCAYEEAAAAQARHVVVRDGAQPEAFEPLHLDAVVDDISQRIDRTTPCEGLLGLRDGPDYSEAESRFVVYFDLHLRSLLCGARDVFQRRDVTPACADGRDP